MENNEDRSGIPDEGAEDIEAARAQIEQTRAEMSDTIDAIEGKLSVERLRGQAQDAIRQVVAGKIDQVSTRALVVAKGRVEALRQMATHYPRQAATLAAGAAGMVALVTVGVRKIGAKGSTGRARASKASSSASKRSGAGQPPGNRYGRSTRKGVSDGASERWNPARSVTAQANALAVRAVGRGSTPKAARVVGALQKAADENILTLIALAGSGGLALAAAAMDRRRTQRRKVRTARLLEAATARTNGAGDWLRRQARRK